jgi:diaminopimelate decarboxylase
MTERIDDCLSVRDGHLFVEDCDAVALAERFGTPLFVVSEDQVRRNFQRYQAAFAKGWPEGEVQVLPSIKAAPLLAVRRILSDEGAGCDTFGDAELEGALRGGARPDLISLNGSIKDAATLRRAIEVGAQIVLDSPRELELCEREAAALGRTARVLFRIKPDLESVETLSDFAPLPIRDLVEMIKYGIPTNEVEPMGPRALALPHVEPLGFHCHIGRHSTELAVWAGLARHAAMLIGRLCRAWGGFEPRVVDLGGGYAAPRNWEPDVVSRSAKPAPPIEAYADAMTGALREAFTSEGLRCQGVTLQVEPGRGIHADTGVHLTRVVNVKASTGKAARRWAETDTSEFFLGTWALDPSTPPFLFRVASRMDARASETWDVVGRSCGAEMILLDAEVPPLAPGDVIALLDTGAYIDATGANFNAMPRPGTVLVRGAEAEWIKLPETIEQVYARDLVPARLVSD